MLALSKDTFI